MPMVCPSRRCTLTPSTARTSCAAEKSPPPIRKITFTSSPVISSGALAGGAGLVPSGSAASSIRV